MTPVESKMKRFGFRTTFLVVGITQVLLAGSILLRGARGAMAQYGVPEDVLSAPHFVDAITWVYVHMLVLASMIILLGVTVREAAAQRWIARGLCAAHLLYTFMDARSSDSILGNGLYQGAASNVPTVLSFIFALLFARLTFGGR